MKTIPSLLLAITILFIAPKAFSQGFGARAGINFSTASDGNFGKVSSNNGFYLGVYKEMKIIPKLLFIQPELQFSKQGFKTKSTNFDVSYLHVPILAKLYALKIVSFETGPQFGFKIGDKVEGLLNPKLKNFDTAWAVGMSFNLPFGLSINGRYVTSFNEIIKNSSSKNQVFQLGAALTL